MPRNCNKYEHISSSQLSSARVMLHAQASYADVPIHWWMQKFVCQWYSAVGAGSAYGLSVLAAVSPSILAHVPCPRLPAWSMASLSPRTHGIRPNDIFVLCQNSEMHTQERAARCCMR